MALRRSPCALLVCTLLAGMLLNPPFASAQGNLRAGFPNLDPAKATDLAAPSYNSIAHTLGIHDQSIDPMTGPANAPFSFMDQLYGAYGYQRQNPLDLQPAADLQKIALYATTNPDGSVKEITHAALQEPDGSWTSKLGAFHVIRHADPYAVNGPQYGVPVATYVRPRGAVNNGPIAGAFRQAGMRRLAGDDMDFGFPPAFDGGGGIAMNAGNPMMAGNGGNMQMSGNGFGNGMGMGIGQAGRFGNRRLGTAGSGATATSFAMIGGLGGRSSASATANSSSTSFAGGFGQGGMCWRGNQGSNSTLSTQASAKGNGGNTTGAGNLMGRDHGCAKNMGQGNAGSAKNAGSSFNAPGGGNSRGFGSQSGGGMLVSIKGNNDTVTINAGPGGLVGNRLRVKIDGNNDTVRINANGRSSTLGNTMHTRTTGNGLANNGGNTSGNGNSLTTKNKTFTHFPKDTGTLVGNKTRTGAGNTHLTKASTGPGNLVGSRTTIRQVTHTSQTGTKNGAGTNVTIRQVAGGSQATAKNGLGSLVGTKTANTNAANRGQLVAKNAGNARTTNVNSATATSKSHAAQLGNRRTGTTTAASHQRTTQHTASMSNFARTGPMASMLHQAANHRAYTQAIANHVASHATVNYSAMHFATAAHYTPMHYAPAAHISVARRR